jgi:F-type H+-transporting ATPase subunit delta
MSKILAKRYARALISIGEEDGLLHERGAALEGFAKALEEAGPAARALTTPVHPRSVRSEILEAVLAKSDLDQMSANLLRLLLSRDRLGLLPDLVASYLAMVDERDGLLRGVLTTASSLGRGEISAIEGALGTMTGRQVRLEVVEDPGVIGGLVARLGDLVVDGSLRTRLERIGRLLAS